MLKDPSERYEHEKFKRLCALAASSSLAPLELSELEEHLDCCKDCSEVLLQYRALSTFGMSSLADGYVETCGQINWDEAAARQRVLRRVAEDRQSAAEPKQPARFPSWRSLAARPLIFGGLAACLLAAVGFGAYHLGAQQHRRANASNASVISGSTPAPAQSLQVLSAEKTFAEQTLAEQGKRLAGLEAESAEKEKDLVRLRAALGSLEGRSSQLAATSAETQAQTETLSRQRDALNTQLQAMTAAYENQRAELTSLRAERDKTVLRTASLEAKVEELTATNNDQERRLKDAEQYLSSDRDIRELMGARKLYIADVFDVDGSSRTQRPFGRVFYTQGKSLIFYAFDLDREPGVINASTFQVWGQREAPQGEQATPMNLGILYKDNDTNRRWVMRFDEPKQLAEIDAVFVTVEPRGGSHKPTSKPFLYALLRNEANHP